MKNSKTKKSSPARKAAKAKSMKMKDLEPNASVKGGYAFRSGGSPSSQEPTVDGYRMFGALIE